MRSTKNIEKLTKEELIITLLKSESSAAEINFEKLFNDNNNNTNDDDNDKMSNKTRDIKMILSRLRNIVDTNDRKKIKKELYEIEKKEQMRKKKKFMIILLN